MEVVIGSEARRGVSLVGKCEYMSLTLLNRSHGYGQNILGSQKQGVFRESEEARQAKELEDECLNWACAFLYNPGAIISKSTRNLNFRFHSFIHSSIEVSSSTFRPSPRA